MAERLRTVLRRRRTGRDVARTVVLSFAVACAGALWAFPAGAATPEDPGSQPESAPEPAEESAQASAEESAEESAEREQRLIYGPIGPYDTLWSIARRVKPADASMAQTLVALVRLNPGAFVGRNVNRIRGGHMLDVPTTAEALATPDVDALRIVSDEDGNWEAFDLSPVPGGSGARPGLSRPEMPRAASEPPATAPPDGEPESPVTEGPHVAVEAERERLAGENAALREEVDAAQRRIETLDETVSKQEEEIAALRGRLAQAPSTVPLLDVVRSVPMPSWLALGLVILLGSGWVLYRRRRVRRGPESASSEDMPPRAADPTEAVDDPAPREEAPAQPVGLPEGPAPEPSPDARAGEHPVEGDAASGYTPNTKLNLARAYVNMGDEETAREVLEEVLAEGDDAERAAARDLLEQLG